ncbi:hypothetical protein IW261DRAFT_1437805 [Armillaria novae-zelandiae]|uniref:Uncharacterized protein n=1 Tax=Armillaria novae-zelandiae TaxID=153914 RepID=A0AA39PVR5_9AGAR|nr:hypothetical protein IW261DRAFT_1437805 [Armillaria novae-zelandiae]
MLKHFSSIVRRHGLANKRYNSTEVTRVARIGKLPEGYDLTQVLRASKAVLSPIEQIVPGQDHVLLRFFDQDFAKRFLLTKSNPYVDDCEYDSPVPLVSAKMAAHCGLGAQRKVRLTAATPITMETARAVLLAYGDPTATDIRIHDGAAFIDLADINNAIKVVNSPDVAGLVDAKFDYFETTRQFRTPSFVTKALEIKYGGKRTVIIRDIQDIAKTEEAVWSTVGSKTSERVLDSHIIPEQKAMVLVFSTARFANEFNRMFKPKGFQVRVTLVKAELYRPEVTAIGMGASRTLQIHGNESQDLAQFGQFGPIVHISQKDDITEITYKSFWDTMNALLRLESGNHHLTGFDGMSVSFSKTEPVAIAPPQLPPSSEPSPSAGGLNFIEKAKSQASEALPQEA